MREGCMLCVYLSEAEGWYGVHVAVYVWEAALIRRSKENASGLQCHAMRTL